METVESNRDYMLSLAEELLVTLAPACEQAQVAGSIRRMKPAVKDIELVVEPELRNIPRMTQQDFFNDQRELIPAKIEVPLYQKLDDLVIQRVIEKRSFGTVPLVRAAPWGDRYRTFTFREEPVDLFMVIPPAKWGVILAIRTGPGDMNQELMRWLNGNGRGVSVKDGQVWQNGRAIETPTEQDFYRQVGLPYAEPQDRSVKWLFESIDRK